MEPLLTKELPKERYGSGVKSISVGIILKDPEHGQRFPIRKPVYKPGKWKSKTLPLEFEDTLEFDIKPPIEEVKAAVSEAQFAEVIRRALGFVFPALLKLEIPNFDTRRFISDLDEALKKIAATK